MNNDPFKVFLQKQRDNQEINEIAALGRLAAPAARLLAKGKPAPRVVGKSALPGAGRLGATRSAIERSMRSDRLPKGEKTAMLARGIDPGGKTKEMPGRAGRVAKAAALAKRKDRPIRSAIGSVASGLKKGVQAIDTPRNRELANKAVKGVAAFAKKGGFSSGFNQLYKDDITTGYRQAGGALGGGLNRLVGVGTKAGDQAEIDRKRGESSRSPRDPFAGLTPTEKRNAMRYGAASGG